MVECRVNCLPGPRCKSALQFPDFPTGIADPLGYRGELILFGEGLAGQSQKLGAGVERSAVGLPHAQSQGRPEKRRKEEIGCH